MKILMLKNRTFTFLMVITLTAAILSGCAAVKPKKMKAEISEADKKTAGNLYLEGKMAEAKENWAEAITAYIEALEYDPESDEIASSLATVFIKDGKIRSSINYIKMAIRLNPSEQKYWRLWQLLEQREGRFDNAAKALKMYMKLNPEYGFNDIMKLSQYYFAMEKHEDAKKLLIAKVKDKHTTAGEMYKIAEMMEFNSLGEEAASVYKTLIERDPLDVKGWLFLGDYYEREGSQEEALENYLKALENNPGSIPVLITIGNHCLVKNDWEGSIIYFEKVYSVGSERVEEEGINYTNVLKTLCSVYFYAGREKSALALFDSLKTAGQDDAALYFSLGKAMNFLNRYEGAAEYYKTGLEKDVGLVAEGSLFRAYVGYARSLIHLELEDKALSVIRDDARNHIKNTNSLKELEASIYLELKRYTDAIAIYEWLLGSDPGNRGYLIGSSMVYDLAGQFKNAEKSLQKILELSPEDPLALNNLAYMYIENDMHIPKAFKMVQKALINDPHNGAYLDTLGWAYYKMGKFKEAKKHIERALKWADKADKGIIFEHYGDVLEKMGEKEKAVEAYHQAIDFGEDEEKILPKINRFAQ